MSSDSKSADGPVSFDPIGKVRPHGGEHPITWFAAITTYFGYAVLVLFGHLRDFFGKVTGASRYFGRNVAPMKGFAPLLKDWENFYTRRLYHRIQDCWNRPIDGPPGAGCTKVIKRVTKDGNYSLQLSDETIPCVNLGSYNYLGFADDWRETCRESVLESLDDYAVSTCATRLAGGNTALHEQLEVKVAEFVGKPAAICFNMGYMTNACTVPALMGKGSLIVSDAFNHTSIVNGARASGATIRIFEHNDADSLDALLREAIVDGQPRTHRPWKKIMVMVEGIYSMEGDICNLKEIVAVAKKYKCYTYLDEAHSIGCLGATGRGACEYTGVDPADIDIMMGTFTKSFGAMGGYIAASKELVAHLRTATAGSVYGISMSPVVVKQTLRAFEVLTGADGTDSGARKLAAIRNNANYFRLKLMQMGCEVYGRFDSPVIPIMLYNPTKIAAFSRELLNRNLAVVVVGFPATPLITSRARFCISAGHTKRQLDESLEKINEVCDLLKLKYRKSVFG